MPASISFVAVGTDVTSTSNTATLTVTSPSSRIGDFQILAVVANSTNNGNFVATPSGGWTLITQSNGNITTPAINLYFKFATAAGTENFNINVTGTPGTIYRRRARIYVYRGVSVLDAVSAINTGSGTTIDYNNVTTTAANDYVLCVGSIGYVTTSGSRAFGTPTGTTSRGAASATTTAPGLALYDELQAAAGLSVSRTGSAATGSTWLGLRLAITPGRSLYWVGGSGTIGSNTRWALSSGGTATVTNSTVADDVNFDSASSASPFTVTLPTNRTLSCFNFTASGLSAALTFALTTTTSNIEVLGGTMSLPATNFAFSGTGGNIDILAASGTTTLTTNGVSIPMGIEMGTPGTLALGSALTITGDIVNRAGTFTTTASNFSVTAAGYSVPVSATTTTTLNSSTVTLTGPTGWSIAVGTAPSTVSASTIILTGSTSAFTALGSVTYGTVTFTNNVRFAQIRNFSNSFNLTITNLTLNAPPTPGYATFEILNSASIPADPGFYATTLNCLGADRSRRILIEMTGSVNNLYSTTKTLIDTDFENVDAFTGTPWTGTRLGNQGSNNGITFDAAKTVYWNIPAGGEWTTDNGWALTSGGTPDLANYPLYQDTVIIDNTGLSSGSTLSISASSIYLPTVTSNKNNAWTFATGSTSVFVYKILTMNSAAVQTGTGTFYASGSTINGNSAVFASNLETNSLRGANQTLINFRTSGTINATGTQLTCSTSLVCSSMTCTSELIGGPSINLGGTGTVGTFSQSTQANSYFVSVNDSSSATKSVSFSVASRAFVYVANGTGFVNISGTVSNIQYQSGFTGTGNGNSSGGIVLASGMNTSSSFTMSGSGTLTTNGATIQSLSITTGTINLSGALTLTGSLSHSGGTFNTQGFTVTCTSYGASGGAAKTITLGTSNIILTGTSGTPWNMNAANTINAVASNIQFTATTSGTRTFAGAGKVYSTVTFGGQGTGSISISGANTFNTLTTNNTTSPFIVQFPASTTQTITNWGLNGTALNRISLRSTALGTQFVLSKATGTVSARYLDIQDSAATGGALWEASNSIDSGNNTGWVFVSGGANFFLLF